MEKRHGISLKLILVLAVAAVSILVIVFARSRDSAARLVQKSRDALARGQLVKAQALAIRAIERDANSDDASLLAARAAMSLRQPKDALAYFERIPDNGSDQAKTARKLSGDILLFGMMQLSGAEEQYRRRLMQDDVDADTNERLAYILGLGSRSWEATPHRLELIRQGKIDRLQLFILSMGELALENPEILRRYQAASPNDPAVLTGLARVAVNEHDIGRAESLLRQAVEGNLDFLEAQAELGTILVQQGADAHFLEWHRRLPPSADDHPGIWAARGWWALNHKQYRGAVRCLWEATRRDSSRHSSNYRLGQALLALDKPQQAKVFFARADAFQRYLYNCHMVHIAPEDDNLEELMEAASSAESLGLLWEAFGWSKLAKNNRRMRRSSAAKDRVIDSPDATNIKRAEETVRRLQPILSRLPVTDRTAPAANPSLQVDLSGYSLPDWADDQRQQESPQSSDVLVAGVEFEEMSAAAGIHFAYINGRAAGESGPAKLYEQLGGGVAILDFDADGWPDIYLTQGGNWPTVEGSFEYIDRLFRNNGDGTFEDVTQRAGLMENRFSQGVAVSDIDNDGWPDLYVANIGLNRLYRNNGDGTFTEVENQLLDGKPQWTTSCAVADFNGDGLPDVYSVNYLSGEDLYTRTCRGPNGGLVPCAIQGFPAAQDQLLENSGDGRFVDVTQESGIVARDGRGLGIVVADFNHTGQLSLFVANDVSPNFLFVNQSPSRSGRARFLEEALPRGLAASNSGSYEACMGIGAGDANGDGQLDLYVTNFFQETSTLYLQDEGLIFHDRTSQANLAQTSMGVLGFGTQFLDGDLDGDLDLIVTNGHINDLRQQGIPYRMRPQYYQNTGRGRFEEMRGSAIGEFFDRRVLGRGLARVDWNRDGLPEAVISHVDDRVALLVNRSRDAGHFISFHLRGVETSRDAVGTTVTAHVQYPTKQHERPFSMTRQLTAGDGFQACNQRLLTFGLGKQPQLKSIEVRWPSGLVQNFNGLEIDSEYLLVEGVNNPYRIPLK